MRKALRDITKNRSIILIYFLLFILLLIASFTVIKDTGSINSRYDKIIDNSIYKIRLMRENRLGVEHIQAATIDVAFHSSSLNDSSILGIQRALSKNDTNLKEFSRYISSKDEDSLFQKVNLEWNKYKSSRKKFIELRGEEQKAMAYYNAEEKIVYENFYKATNELSNLVYDNVKKEDTAVDKVAFYSELKINSLIAITIVLLITLGFIVVRNVKKLNHQQGQLIAKEKTLQESEKLYKNLFDKSPLPKWVCDRTTLQIYEVNDAALKLYGYSKEEFLNLTVFDIRPKEEHEKLKKFIARKDFATNNNGVRKHIKKDGEIIWVEIGLDEILYKEKEAILVAIHDVTEKIKTEEALKNSEDLYRSLFTNSPVFVWVCDLPTLKHLEVNETALNHYGYSKEEFLSMTAFDLLPEEDREELKQRIQNKNSEFHGYDKHLKKNGELINVEIRVQVINYKGKQAGLVIGTDVTKKLENEKSVKESEELYRSLFDKNPLPIFVVNKKRMQMLEANEAAVELYGYSKKELLKMTAFDIRAKEDHEILKDAINNGNADDYKNYNVRHIKNNGEKIIVDVIAETIHYKGNEAFLAIIRDVTKTLQLQNQLNEEKINRQKEITRATIDGQEKERGELGKELHDNINQILACAKLYLGSAGKADINKKDELIEESKGLIDSGIQEIRKLSKSLVPPALTKSTLKESIEELIDPLRITTDKKIETVFSVPDESILCDKIKITIYRIVQEQMNNILKYADASKIRIELKQDNYKLLLQVKDNGKGFDVKAKRKGIGLTNIANRAEIYNGKVVIDSVPGNGCTLSVFFPLEHLQNAEKSGNGIVTMSTPGMAS